MHWLRQILMILGIGFMMLGSSSAVLASDQLAWTPTPMSSKEAAITALKDLKGFFLLSQELFVK